MKYILIGLMLCFFYFTSLAQRSKVDSLFDLLKNDREDTNKVNHLNALGWQLMSNNPDTSIILGNQALVLCDQLSSIPQSKFTINNFKSNILGNLGVYSFFKGDYPKALDYYLKALKINEEMLSKAQNLSEKQTAQQGIATRFGNIGNVYNNQADYSKALDYYLKALKIDEELNNKNGIAKHLSNIGNVYCNQDNYPKALDYDFKALKMAEELGKGIATITTLKQRNKNFS
ncbi:MAG: tetratricopeptide repeat protein [Bacteroidetes bacterium]|nr:tetratricopeptide repeat protein [Bacteroidota bacterium]